MEAGEPDTRQTNRVISEKMATKKRPEFPRGGKLARQEQPLLY